MRTRIELAVAVTAVVALLPFAWAAQPELNKCCNEAYEAMPPGCDDIQCTPSEINCEGESETVAEAGYCQEKPNHQCSMSGTAPVVTHFVTCTQVVCPNPSETKCEWQKGGSSVTISKPTCSGNLCVTTSP